MSASVRDELIRLGIIKPVAPSSEPPPPPHPYTAPSPKQNPVHTQVAAKSKPEKVAEPKRPPKQKNPCGRKSVSQRPREFHEEMPGDAAWFNALEALAKKLCAMKEREFRAYLSGKQAENLFNICEYINRVMQGRRPPPCWLVNLTMDFGNLGQALQLTDGALWEAYHHAAARHQAAMAAWEALRVRTGGDQTYTRLTARYPHGSEGRRWIDAAWDDPSLLTRRNVELRSAMAAYATQRLRHKIGLKRAPAQLPSSVWEATGHSRRFGGGRPRSERFRR